MKKFGIILSAIVLIAAVVSLVFVVGTSASTTPPEAQLTTTPSGGTATTENGTLDAMIEKVNAAVGTATVDTAYEIKLLANATATKALSLGANASAAESVTILLDGYTITTNTGASFIKVDGISEFKIRGGYSKYTTKGALVGSATFSGNMIEVTENSAASDVKAYDLDITIPALSAGENIISHAAGNITLANTSVKYTAASASLGASDERTLVKSTAGRLVFSLSEVENTSANGKVTAVDVAGGVLRLEKGKITADYAVRVGKDAWVVIVDNEMTVKNAAFAPAADITGARINLGGVTINTSGDITEGDALALQVDAFYGTGSSKFTGKNPSGEFNLKTNTTVETLGSGWTLKKDTSSTVVVTLFNDTQRTTHEEVNTNTVRIITVLNNAALVSTTDYVTLTSALMKDGSASGIQQSLITGDYSNGTVTMFYDLNGHTITKSGNANLFFLEGEYRLYFDGEDVSGNRGGYASAGTSGMIIYPKDTSAATELDGITSFSNMDFTYSQLKSGQTMLQLRKQHFYFDGIKMTYTGADVADGTTFAFNFIGMQYGTKVVMKNTEFIDTNTKGVTTTAFFVRSNDTFGYVHMDGIKATGVDVVTNISALTSIYATMANSNISADGVPYKTDTKATQYIHNTKTTLTSGIEVADGNIYFSGTEGTLVKTNGGELPTGGKIEGDYGFVFDSASNGYVIRFVGHDYITIADIYQSGMVLQGKKPLTISGKSSGEGSTVTVKIGDAVASGVVSRGKWSVTFEPLDYAKGLTLTISDDIEGSVPKKFTDIDIGEIWLMSGQSNAAYPIGDMEDFDEYVANADNYKNIKACIIPQSQSMVEKGTVVAGTKWTELDAAALKKFASYTSWSKNNMCISAIAYVAATRLSAELGEDVTIAIIDANFSGSTVESWIDPDLLPTYAPAEAAIYKKYLDFYTLNGRYPEQGEITLGAGEAYITEGKLYQRMGAGCFNAIIAPLTGLTIRGSIWYQGEGNGADVTETSDAGYELQWNGVLESFRQTFGDSELPMYVIQLPPYLSAQSDMKNLQYSMVEKVPGAYLVSNALTGPVFSTDDMHTSKPDTDTMVHYARKSLIGVSLAAEILEHTYGKGEVGAPNVIKTEIIDGKVVLTFDRDIEFIWGTKVEGFEVNNGTAWISADAVIEGRTVVLTPSEDCTPVSVRYGYGGAVFEFEDGTILAASKALYNYTYTAIGTIPTGYGSVTKTIYQITITEIATGNVLYTFSSEETPIIRCRGLGNIAATNGQTLACFKIELS